MIAPQSAPRVGHERRRSSGPAPRPGLRDLVKVLRRRRSIMVATVALVTLATALLANAMTPRYTARAAIAIEPHETRVPQSAAVTLPVPRDRATIETEIRVLGSRWFARAAIEALGPLEEPDLNPELRARTRRGSDDLMADYVKPLAHWLPDSWLVATGLAKPVEVAAIDPDAEPKALERAIDVLLDGLSVARAGDSSVIEVAYTADDPHQAARIANAVASLFVGSPLDTNRRTVDRDPVAAGARVISRARAPGGPDFPQPRLMIAVGFGGSLMLGMLLAIGAEGMDSGLRSGRQVEQALGIPNLGLVPKLTGLKDDKPHKYLTRMPRSAYAEAVRAVQVGLHFCNPERPPQVILVTSSLPGEGKTTLALSLAATAARSGHKTIVVDLDMRHPSVRRELGQAISAPGLVEVVSGENTLDEVIHRDATVPNLHAITAGRSTSNPTDLLASPRLLALLIELRSRYADIILDTPPLLGLADTRMAAALADAVLLAVHWGKSNHEVASNAIDSLRGSWTIVAGAVLTQVDVRSRTRRAYGDALQYYDRYEKYYLN